MTPEQIEKASYAISAMRPQRTEKARFKDVMKARQTLEDRRYSPPADDAPDKPMVRILMSWLNEKDGGNDSL